MIRGIDVYDGQGEVGWPEVFASGVSFALIKATESTGNVQDTFAVNREAAAAAGISPLGLYHFARPENGNPEAQADHYLRVIGSLGPDEFVALDVETGNVATWPDFILRWFARIESQLGMVPCCLYLSDSPAGSMTIAPATGRINGEDERSSRPTPGRSMSAHAASTVARSLAGTSCGQFPLWDAGYGPNTGAPPKWGTGFEPGYHGPFEHSWNVGPWPTWTIWQYSSVGRVPGIGGGRANVDVNLAPDDLRSRLGFQDSPAPPPTPPQPQQEDDMVSIFDGPAEIGGGIYASDGDRIWGVPSESWLRAFFFSGLCRHGGTIERQAFFELRDRDGLARNPGVGLTAAERAEGVLDVAGVTCRSVAEVTAAVEASDG